MTYVFTQGSNRVVWKAGKFQVSGAAASRMRKARKAIEAVGFPGGGPFYPISAVPSNPAASLAFLLRVFPGPSECAGDVPTISSVSYEDAVN